MPEDKLSHDERLRLECLSQAIGYYVGRAFVAPSQVVATADIYEKYVRDGRSNVRVEPDPTN